MDVRNTIDDRNYRRYLFLLIGLVLIWVISIVAVISIYGDRLRPPPFSGSISFDEKAVWLSDRLKKGCDILSIGSSMTLCNLHSEVFSRVYSDQRYVNASSWGFKIRQTVYFINFLRAYITPKTIIIVTAPVDFGVDKRPDAIFKTKNLNSFFRNNNLTMAHITHSTIDYLRKTMKDMRTRLDIYESLKFDAGGGIAFEIYGKAINKDRYNKYRNTIFLERVDQRNYQALEQLAALCKEDNIRLIVAQSPMRLALIDKKAQEFLSDHWLKLKTICLRYDQEFYNLHLALNYSDEYFSDWGHLNANGAKGFTKVLIQIMDSNSHKDMNKETASKHERPKRDRPTMQFTLDLRFLY